MDTTTTTTNSTTRGPDEANVLPVTEQQQTPQAPAPATTEAKPWWHVHLFRGMVNDIRQRAPYYLSDWTDAWDYRVVPATVYMYFAK
ncbi:putative transporter [Beauveria bassiana]|uniref:Putative transporter n=1 Tax=Beauveria bassiana TaxID=176275 RepID=A0A2N6NMT4_BEABA|nr:putative transporter [Beauveria bassiana]